MSGLNSILYYGYLGTMEESAECSHFKFTVGHFFHTLRSQKNVQRGIQQNQIKKWKCFNDITYNDCCYCRTPLHHLRISLRTTRIALVVLNAMAKYHGLMVPAKKVDYTTWCTNHEMRLDLLFFDGCWRNCRDVDFVEFTSLFLKPQNNL